MFQTYSSVPLLRQDKNRRGAEKYGVNLKLKQRAKKGQLLQRRKENRAVLDLRMGSLMISSRAICAR
jgi:hypothetical protein